MTLFLSEAAKKVDSTYQPDEFIHLDLASDIFSAILGIKRDRLPPHEKVDFKFESMSL